MCHRFRVTRCDCYDSAFDPESARPGEYVLEAVTRTLLEMIDIAEFWPYEGRIELQAQGQECRSERTNF